MVLANNEMMDKIGITSKDKPGLIEFEKYWQQKLDEIKEIENKKNQVIKDFIGSCILLIPSFLFTIIDIIFNRKIVKFYNYDVFALHFGLFFLILSCVIYLIKVRKYWNLLQIKKRRLEETIEENEPSITPLQEVHAEPYVSPNVQAVRKFVKLIFAHSINWFVKN
jgi:hypothetical protein